jgi:FG-GAP-like repeat/FG-GAP repeat
MKRLFAIAAWFAFLISNSAKSGAAGFQSAVDYPVGTAPRAITSADFNGDGKMDLAVANSGNGAGDDGGISILLGNGDGTFQATNNFTVGKSPVAIAASDFNLDGRSDLVVIDNSGVGLLLGNGNGTFSAATYLSTPTGPVSLAVADLDNDHISDLVVFASSLSVLLGNGDGTFQPHVDYPAVSGQVLVGDVNGDGKLDVVVASFGVRVNVLLGNGDGSLQSAISSVGGSLSLSIASAAADFDLDGKADLALSFDKPTTKSGGTLLMPGNGDGTFQLPSSNILNSSGALSAADFNGDGKADLVVVSPGSAILLLGNGDNTFQNVLSVAVGAGPYRIVTVDFNQDNAPDLAITNSADNTVSVLVNSIGADFSISASPFTPATISRGQSSTSTVTLAHQNTFDSPVELSCSVEPAQSAPTCSIDPDSVTFDASGNATATLAINTNSATAPLAAYSAHQDAVLQFVWLQIVGAALLGTTLQLRRFCTRKQMKFVIGTLLLGGLIFQAACGGSSPPPSQTYTVTITGISESTQHSATLTVTVR